MANLFSRIGDVFKPNSKFIPAGTAPMDLPTVRRPKASRGKTWLLVLAFVGCVALVVAGAWEGIRRTMGWNDPPPTATAAATLPNPGLAFEGTATPLPNILTQQADLPTQGPTYTASATAFSLLTSTPSATPTLCAADHFLTQLVCDDLARTATLEAAPVGAVINVSGVDPAVTTVYVYPTDPPTPWIVTGTFTNTPVVITATPGPTQTPYIIVHTAQPGPTQTPWFFITQPPVVTVVWTQIVTVEITREVQVPVTVVVTATPTNTLPPTETPTP